MNGSLGGSSLEGSQLYLGGWRCQNISAEYSSNQR